MSTERSKCQPCLDPRLALGLRHVPVIPPMRDHCGYHLPVLRNQLLLVLANSKVLGLARAKRDALPVLLKEWRSMIGSPQDRKSCIDFCVVFSNQDDTLLFGFAQSWLILLVRVQATSPTAGWNRTREPTMLETLCFLP